jgi:hypothetical protein
VLALPRGRSTRAAWTETVTRKGVSASLGRRRMGLGDKPRVALVSRPIASVHSKCIRCGGSVALVL